MPSPSQRRDVVTGAGSGIGNAAVRRLARAAVRVLAVDVNSGCLAEQKGEAVETLTA